jgi:hypothetical protein
MFFDLEAFLNFLLKTGRQTKMPNARLPPKCPVSGRRRSERLAKNLAMRLYLRNAFKAQPLALCELLTAVWRTGLLFPEQLYLFFALGPVEVRNGAAVKRRKFKPKSVAVTLVRVLDPSAVAPDDHEYFLGDEVFEATPPPSDRDLRKIWDKVGVKPFTRGPGVSAYHRSHFVDSLYIPCQANPKHGAAAARFIGAGGARKGPRTPLFPDSGVEVGLLPRCTCKRYNCDEECVFLCLACAAKASGDGQDHHAFLQGWECLACCCHHDRAFAYQSVRVEGCACRGVVLTPKKRKVEAIPVR